MRSSWTTWACLALAISFFGWLPSDARAQGICDCTVMPTLGSAVEFGAMSVGAGKLYMQGAAFADDGNVGVGPGTSIELLGAAGLGGYIKHHPGTSVVGGAGAAGGVITTDTSGYVADLVAASAAFAALTPTQIYNAKIDGNTVISGSGCINVINVVGGIELKGNKQMRLQGTIQDYFIINVWGSIITQGDGDIVLDGMPPSNVIYNVRTAGAEVDLQGNSGGFGTYLNLEGRIYLQGNTGGKGAYYAAGGDLEFIGSTDFFASPFQCTVTDCPDPESSGINIQTPSTPPTRSTGNRPFFYAFFDPATFEGHLESFRVAPDGSIRGEDTLEAVDPVTDELEPTRDSYWDAGEGLKSNVSRTLYTTDATGARATFDSSVGGDLDVINGEVSAYPNYPASGITNTGKLKAAIIDYVYGRDAFDEDGDADYTELRTTVLGDIFRSNPVYIGSPTTLLAHEDGYSDFVTAYDQRDHAVYAGANDGVFHAFNAGDYFDPDDPDPAVFDVGDGSERFGYVPRQLLDKIKLTARTQDIPGDRLHPGFVDGNIVAADAWLGDGTGSDITKSGPEWATVMLTAFREGGDGYLALDVTDPDAGAMADHGPYPKLLWEFSEVDLAQSWSRPVIGRVKLAGAGSSGDNCGSDDGDGDCMEVWVAIFGGGYELEGDPNKLDFYIDDPTSAAWDDASKAIFMVRLDNGQVLAKVEFDSTGVKGPADMLYSIASAPAAVDLDGDRFLDLVLIGDTGGQLWKWDISSLGVDGDADLVIDNWPHGIIFKTSPTLLSDGTTKRYKSLFNPPAVAFVNGKLNVVLGTGSRNDLLYAGDSAVDDENRLYVFRDAFPTGASAFSTLITEADLTDISATGLYADMGTDEGYFIVGEEGEKFIADPVVFAGYAIVPSYGSPRWPVCGPGDANLFLFKLYDASGFWDADAVYTAADRKVRIGAGIPSNPRVSVASDPNHDKIFINTSDGQVITITPPVRDAPMSESIYWKQNF